MSWKYLRGLYTALGCLAAVHAHADGGHADRGSQGLYPGCNNPVQPPPANLRQDREAAVFSVWVSGNSGSFLRNGTASLIDDTGIFLTAGHVVHFDVGRPIKIRQRSPVSNQEFDVQVLWSEYNDNGQDMALLKAEKWKNGARFPFPFRFDDVSRADGNFIGFDENRDDPVYKHLGYYATISTNKTYEALVFAHSSGALLFDNYGRAFAMVTKYEVPMIDSPSPQPQSQNFKNLQKRLTVWAFPLNAKILKNHIPPSHYMANLIDTLRTKITSDNIPVNLGSEATPIDLMYLYR